MILQTSAHLCYEIRSNVTSSLRLHPDADREADKYEIARSKRIQKYTRMNDEDWISSARDAKD